MASANVIRELLVSVGVDVEPDGFAQFDRGIGQLKDGLGTLLKMAGAAAGAIALVTTALGLQADATAREAVELDRLAKSVGTTAQEIGGLALAFGKVGGDTGDVADVLGTLADRAEDAKGGMQSFIDDFALIGLEVDDLKGKDPVGLLDAFADAIAATEDPNKRVAASVRILGDDVGNKLLPVLMRGSAGLDAFKESALATGAVLDADATAASERYIETTRLVGVEIKAIRNTIGALLIPAMEALAIGVLEVVRSFRVMLRENVAGYAEKIGRGFEILRDAVRRNSTAIVFAIGTITAAMLALAASGVIVTGILAIVAVVGGLASVLSSVAAGLALIGGGSILIGIAAVLGGAAALFGQLILAIAPFILLAIAAGLAIDDLLTFMSGGESIIGAFIAGFEGTDTVAGALIETFKALRGAFDSFYGAASEVATMMAEILGPSVESVGDGIIGVFDRITAAIRFTISAWSDLIGTMAIGGLDMLTSALDGLAGAYDGFGSSVAGANQVFERSDAAPSAPQSSNSLALAQTININGAGDPSATASAVMSKTDSGMRSAIQAMQGGAG